MKCGKHYVNAQALLVYRTYKPWGLTS